MGLSESCQLSSACYATRHDPVPTVCLAMATSLKLRPQSSHFTMTSSSVGGSKGTGVGYREEGKGGVTTHPRVMRCALLCGQSPSWRRHESQRVHHRVPYLPQQPAPGP